MNGDFLRKAKLKLLVGDVIKTGFNPAEREKEGPE